MPRSHAAWEEIATLEICSSAERDYWEKKIRITNEIFEGQLLSTLLTCLLCTAAQGEVDDSRYV